jgi:hypothetical protein
VNPWWWVPIGLAAWFVVGATAGLVTGRVLWRRVAALEAEDRRVVARIVRASARRRHERTAKQGSSARRDPG